jgi:hypothetical protein
MSNLELVKPRSVTVSVQAIWVTNLASALLMVAQYDGTPGSDEMVVFNVVLLALYVMVTIKIAAGKNWARLTYAFLVALECAVLAAFGLDQASELEALVTYLTLPLEIWILWRLFGAQSDAWFKLMRKK